MKAKIWFSALAAATLACACGGSCVESSPPSGGGGGSRADASGGKGGDADAPPDHADAPNDDSMDSPEEPVGDAGWKPVPWSAPCVVEVAGNPGAAAPPLIWDPCQDGEAGCEQARLDWDHSIGQPFGSLNVLRWGAGYRVGALLFYKDKERRAVIYDEAGSPLVVWRTSACTIVVPMLTPTRAWMGAQGTEARWILEPYETLATATSTINVQSHYQGYAASEDALGLWGVTGQTATIYDRLADSAKQFAPPPGIGFYQPYPVKGSAVMRQFPEFNRAEGWIWNHGTNLATPLVQPGISISVADIKSDGETLVWVEGALPVTQNGSYASADLWTSPFTTDKGGLVATKRRSLPTMGKVSSHASEGYYGVYGPVDKMVHVYRLSDARHWSFKPPASSLDFYAISYVDKSLVWYQALTDVYRQALATLGPGDLPP